MDNTEIRLRLIEAAAEQPAAAHGSGGWAEGVLATARTWEQFVLTVWAQNAVPTVVEVQDAKREVLGLPKKTK